MSSSKKKNVGMKKADIDFYRMTGVFAIVCLFIVLVLRMESTITARHSTGNNITYNFYKLCHNPVFIGFCALVALGAIIWFAVNKVKKHNESMRIFRSSDAVILVAYFAVFWLCFGVYANSLNHMFFIAFTIISSVLFYISRLYKADFIFYSTLNALFAFILYFISDKFSIPLTIFKVALIVFSIIAIILFSVKNKSHFKTSKHNKLFLYIPSYISLVFFAVFLFLRAFTYQSVNPMTVNAMLVIMLIQYLICAIIYTLRLIRE